MNFTLPSPGYLLASMVFGVIGVGAFMYGKKQALMKPMAIGVALMAYPYFISRVWLLWVVGVALCVALYLPRD